MLQRVIENTYDILIDERLASGEGKLFDPQTKRFIDKRNDISKRNSCSRSSPGLEPSRQKGQARLQAVPVWNHNSSSACG